MGNPLTIVIFKEELQEITPSPLTHRRSRTTLALEITKSVLAQYSCCSQNGLRGCWWPRRSLLTSKLNSVASITHVPVLFLPLQYMHFGCRRKSLPVGGDFRRQPKCKTCKCFFEPFHRKEEGQNGLVDLRARTSPQIKTTRARVDECTQTLCKP